MRRLLVCALLVLAASSPSSTNATDAPGLRVVLLSDFNGPYGSTSYPPALAKVMRRVVNEFKPDLFLSAGDVVAGQKLALTDDTRRAMWASFDRDVTAKLRAANIPYGFAVGNHDGSSARDANGRFVFAADRAALARYWQARRPPLAFVDDSRFPFAFSFVHGGVFFLMVDASSATLQDRAWIETQLSSEAATSAAMRVVVGHLPLFGVSEGRSRAGEVLQGGETLRGLFERLGVHTYVSGHHAAFYPGRRGRLNVLASGGIGGRDLLGHPGTARSTVTLMEVRSGEALIRLRTFDADSEAEIDVATLPPFLNGFGGRVERVSELR
ncbi:metallophosphoesterase family protein [Deinococcus yavapaiensis]|uniref:Calcineurin-like phosphoesterase family protein n=1 Tax=Deinococcus yavapaiensis KR-236 TaxID=694435 RepID=A0A318SIB3_9DEIO|nr:metallophosphoesterase [Deinococcus yavapaiensis]PYE53797.1 calcineurin-like phosphoesterase family protein [Deinococcus yavapaiensis KR-236]